MGWVQLLRIALAHVYADIATKPMNILGYKEPIQLMESTLIEPFNSLVVKTRMNNLIPYLHLVVGMLKKVHYCPICPLLRIIKMKSIS